MMWWRSSDWKRELIGELQAERDVAEAKESAWRGAAKEWEGLADDRLREIKKLEKEARQEGWNRMWREESIGAQWTMKVQPYYYENLLNRYWPTRPQTEEVEVGKMGCCCSHEKMRLKHDLHHAERERDEARKELQDTQASRDTWKARYDNLTTDRAGRAVWHDEPKHIYGTSPLGDPLSPLTTKTYYCKLCKTEKAIAFHKPTVEMVITQWTTGDMISSEIREFFGVKE